MQNAWRAIWRIFLHLKTVLLIFLLIGSLGLNGILFLGGSLFSAVNSSFEVISGIQTIASRNRTQIASLSEEVAIERIANRELKGELGEASADLADSRIANRKLKSEAQNLTTELVSERKINRELKGQVAEVSGDLIIERNAKLALKTQVSEQAAELAAVKATNRQIKSQIRDIGMGVVPFKGKKVALKEAVDETADTIGKRAVKTARREVASMPAEAIPYLGTAIIVGVTALEIYDLCATLKDMSALKRAFDPDFQSSEDELEVCSIKIPPKEQIIEAVKGSPQKAWEAATTATPSWSELKELEFPEVSWTEMWENTKEGASDTWINSSEGVKNWGKKAKHWWSADRAQEK